MKNEIEYEFKLIKEIGNGRTATVYIAEELATKVKYAIKKIKVENNPEKYIQEQKLLENLNCPNVIKLHSTKPFFYINDNIYIVVEYCNGGDLYDYIQHYFKKHQTYLDQKTIQHCLKQIINGIDYLHKNNIVHRDLKIENILIHFPEHNDRAVSFEESDISKACLKICDFGFSKKISKEEEKMAEFVGTPLYMPPEVLFGADYDRNIDLWNLGIVLFEMLSGQTPFYGSSQEKIIKLVREGKYYLSDKIKISYECLHLLIQLLQNDSKRRVSLEKIKKHIFFLKDTIKLTMYPIEKESENGVLMIDTNIDSYFDIKLRKECEKLSIEYEKYNHHTIAFYETLLTVDEDFFINIFKNK